MRVLLSTIGSRGDVEPLVALALRLKTLGHDVRICAPPDFHDLIEGLGISAFDVGPQLRGPAGTAGPAPQGRPTPEQLRALAEATVGSQFTAVEKAAAGCDVIVAATALQVAARSVAESLGIPYIYTSYCPVALPSAHHAPPPMPGQPPPAEPADNLALWEGVAAQMNGMFGAALNARRASLGLPPVADVASHIYGSQPWLAADPMLGPWPEAAGTHVFQTGAWLRDDPRRLPAEVEAFIDAAEPPVYFGLGSMRVPSETSRLMIEAARANGRRAIVSRGWAGLSLIDDAPDCLLVDEVNQQALFQRVAAVVHHGGAGTTTVATRAGAPQLVLPQVYDQHYWGRRVADLGIGLTLAAPAAGSLAESLGRVLQPGMATAARSVAGRIRADGALVAAQRITELKLEDRRH